MAKLNRFTGKIFGSGAGTDQISQFGSLFAGSPAFTTDPSVAQGLSNYLTGWLAAAIGGNAPAIEDMNSVLFVLSYQINYLLQNGISEWDAGTTYAIGSLATSSTGTIYRSLQDPNLNHALTDSAYWQIVSQPQAQRNVSADETATAADYLLRVDPTLGDIVETLPAIATCPVGHQIVVKVIGSGSNLVTVKGNGAELIDNANTFILEQSVNASLTVRNNGTTWDVI